MTRMKVLLLMGALLPCALAAAPPAHEPDYTVRLSVVLDAAATPPVLGEIDLEVHPSWAPLGAARFKELAASGYYDGCRFFRVVPGFVAQIGIAAEPAVAAAWKERRIEDDPVRESNKAGYVSFATSGRDSRTTQWFVNLQDNARLDAMGFAPFARVVRGMDSVVRRLFGGYGEAPRQGEIQRLGEPYLAERFPRLARVAGCGFVERAITRLYAPDIAARAAACARAGEECETPVLLRQLAAPGSSRKAGPLLAVFGAAGPNHANRIHDKLLEVPLFPNQQQQQQQQQLAPVQQQAPASARYYSSFRAHIIVRGDFCRPDVAALTNGALPAANLTALRAGGSSGRFALAPDTAPSKLRPIDPHGDQLGSAATAAGRAAAAAQGARAATDCDFVVGLSDGATVLAVGRGTDGNDALVPFPAGAAQRPDSGTFYRRFGSDGNGAVVPPYAGGDFQADVGWRFNASRNGSGVALRVFDDAQAEPPEGSAIWFFEPPAAAAAGASASASDDPADTARTRVRMPNGNLRDLRLVAYRDDPPQAYALREIAVELEYVVRHGAVAEAAAANAAKAAKAARAGVAEAYAAVAKARAAAEAREAAAAAAAAEALGEADRAEGVAPTAAAAELAVAAAAAAAAVEGVDDQPAELRRGAGGGVSGAANAAGAVGGAASPHPAGHVADVLLTGVLLVGAVAYAAHDLRRNPWRRSPMESESTMGQGRGGHDDEIQMLATTTTLSDGSDSAGGDYDEHV